MGVDTNPTTVEAVNNSREPFPGEKDLAALLTSVVADGRLSATTDTQAAVRASDFVVVVVPVFVDGQGIPDFASIDAATRAIGQALRPGTVVSYETTLPVGTTRNRFAPLIEDGSGLRVGADFSVVFSPERVFTGRVLRTFDATRNSSVASTPEAVTLELSSMNGSLNLTIARIWPDQMVCGISAPRRLQNSQSSQKRPTET